MTTEKEEVTPWLPGSVKPHYTGVYERQYDGDDILPCLWDGYSWLVHGDDVDDALAQNIPSNFQDQPWRGLFTPPATYAKGSK